MAEAGATPAQEVAFTLANGIEYVRAALAAGLAVDDFAPRLSFFFVARTTLLEEVAKFRAARRIWAAGDAGRVRRAGPASRTMLRFHTQTAGVQLTAQQPEVNLVRVTVQALAAVLGGTQSLHTNSYDEAIALPTEKAARLALRTQQVLAYETDLTATVDPFAGSYAVEAMTDELEAEIRELMDTRRGAGRRGRRDRGRASRSARSSSRRTTWSRSIEDGYRMVVGVNRFRRDADETYEPLRVDPAIEAAAGRPAGPAAGRARQRRRSTGTSTALRAARRGHRQRALPDAGRAAGPGHGRRGLQRAARRLGRLPPRRRLLTGRSTTRWRSTASRGGKVAQVTSTVDPLRRRGCAAAGPRGSGQGPPRRAGRPAPRPARPSRAVLGRDPHHPPGARAAAGRRAAAAAAAGRHRPGLRHRRPGARVDRRCGPTSTRCRIVGREGRALPLHGARRLPRLRPRRAHDRAARRRPGAGRPGRTRASCPGAVRLIFQPAEESARRRAGRDRGRRASTAWSGSSRCTATPRTDVGRVGLRGGADHRVCRPGAGAAARAGRAHRPAAPDRRPGLRARQGRHRAAGRAVPPGRPAGRAERGLGPDRGRAARPTRSRPRARSRAPCAAWTPPPGTTRPTWSRRWSAEIVSPYGVRAEVVYTRDVPPGRQRGDQHRGR